MMIRIFSCSEIRYAYCQTVISNFAFFTWNIREFSLSKNIISEGGVFFGHKPTHTASQYVHGVWGGKAHEEFQEEPAYQPVPLGHKA